MKIFVLHARSRKLGDSLVTASVIRDFSVAIKSSSKAELVVLLPKTFSPIPEIYRLKVIYYQNELSALIFAVYLRTIAFSRGRELIFSNISGHSGCASMIKWILNPRSWSTRCKNEAYGCVDGNRVRRMFSHSSQFEYSELPLNLLFPDFHATRNVFAENRVFRRVDTRVISISPFSAEKRRSIRIQSLLALISQCLQHGPVQLIFNSKDKDYEKDVDECRFRFLNNPSFFLCQCNNLNELWRALRRSSEVFVVDSGVYVLAATAGAQVTVIYGPSQPHKTIYNPRSIKSVVRDTRLGENHCHNNECTEAYCIDSALGRLSAVRLPHPCLLRTNGDSQVNFVRSS